MIVGPRTSGASFRSQNTHQKVGLKNRWGLPTREVRTSVNRAAGARSLSALSNPETKAAEKQTSKWAGLSTRSARATAREPWAPKSSRCLAPGHARENQASKIDECENLGECEKTLRGRCSGAAFRLQSTRVHTRNHASKNARVTFRVAKPARPREEPWELEARARLFGLSAQLESGCVLFPPCT